MVHREFIVKSSALLVQSWVLACEARPVGVSRGVQVP